MKKYIVLTEDEFCQPELDEFYACDENTEQTSKTKENLSNKILMKRTEYISLCNQFNELAQKICKSE